MKIGILLILLIGPLVPLYLTGKLIFKCVRLFRGGHVADALWLASALCAMIGIGILIILNDEKSFLGIALLGFMYFVIRGFWLFLHWIDGIPVGSLDDHDRGVNDGVNEPDVPHGFTIGPEGLGHYFCGFRIDND